MRKKIDTVYNRSANGGEGVLYYSLMNILLNMPTAANVMQDATFHKIRRFLSLGKTQSMLYSFFVAIAIPFRTRRRYTRIVLVVIVALLG